MSIPGLCRTDLKYYLGLESTAANDAALDVLMGKAESAVERFCDRTFHYEELTEYISLREPQDWLACKKWPIASVAGLTTDWQNSRTEFTVATELIVDEEQYGDGIIQINTTSSDTVNTFFYAGHHNNVITYTAGYSLNNTNHANDLDNLQEAVYQVVGDMWSKRQSMGKESETIGDWSASFTPIMVRKHFPQEVRDMLIGYMRLPPHYF